ncbi:Uu.00g012850.m01.CDS01 [Anthostomella pinea]|uniref:Uu.00g012850.m01.CDS01 n=1 Tax=Anthostomella pinea TaxID=933095 RepID=A0AAI8VS92_9PEZI|nr:Uu.00g012850.m01.CDS01 [Anthostomella pinea]
MRRLSLDKPALNQKPSTNEKPGAPTPYGALRVTFPRAADDSLTLSGTNIKASKSGTKNPDDEKPVLSGNPYEHTYEVDRYTSLHSHCPPALGPGQLQLWAIVDPETLGSALFSKKDKAAWASTYMSLLATTTIKLLWREFGIPVYADESGNVRVGYSIRMKATSKIIATSYGDVNKAGITSFGISLHVGGVYDHHSSVDYTSITEKLMSDQSLPEPGPAHTRIMNLRRFPARTADDTQGESLTRTDQVLYERTGLSTWLPLGMDNFRLAVCWSQELSRQLGLETSLVHHMPKNEWRTTDASKPRRSFTFRPTVVTEWKASTKAHNERMDTKFAVEKQRLVEARAKVWRDNKLGTLGYFKLKKLPPESERTERGVGWELVMFKTMKAWQRQTRGLTDKVS